MVGQVGCFLRSRRKSFLLLRPPPPSRPRPQRRALASLFCLSSSSAPPSATSLSRSFSLCFLLCGFPFLFCSLLTTKLSENHPSFFKTGRRQPPSAARSARRSPPHPRPPLYPEAASQRAQRACSQDHPARPQRPLVPASLHGIHSQPPRRDGTAAPLATALRLREAPVFLPAAPRGAEPLS